MSERAKSQSPRLLGLLAAGLLGMAAEPAAAQAPAAAPPAAPAPPAAGPANPCAPISFRSWQESGEKAHVYGQDIELFSGEEMHVYIQVLGADGKPHGTSAVIGYPGEFGFGGNALEVLKKVRMEAQNAADRQYGRIRFRSAEPGGASLGYRIEAVDAPGQLSRLPEACRVGQLNILVQPPRAPVSLEPEAISPREAAEQLVVLLYYGILRRKIVDQFDQSYVEMVQKQSRAGIEQIAETIFESKEFRESAYRRAEERHGTPRRGGKSLTELLLGEMYDALYGRRGQPPTADVRRDLEDLDICLKGKAYVIETCGRLGRTLVGRQLFYDHNRDLIDSLAARPESPELRPATIPGNG